MDIIYDISYMHLFHHGSKERRIEKKYHFINFYTSFLTENEVTLDC